MWQSEANVAGEGGEAGKRTGLKTLYLQRFAGSTPAPRTTEKRLKIPHTFNPLTGKSLIASVYAGFSGFSFFCPQLSTQRLDLIQQKKCGRPLPQMCVIFTMRRAYRLVKLFWENQPC